MKRLFIHSHVKGAMRTHSHLPARAPHARVAAFAFLILCMSVIALVYVVPVPAQHGRDWREAEARRKREIQACMRKWEVAFQQTIKDAQHEKLRAERKAEDDYKTAIRNATSDAARSAARKAKMEALRKAEIALKEARRAAQEIMRAAGESCNNPKPPETANSAKQATRAPK